MVNAGPGGRSRRWSFTANAGSVAAILGKEAKPEAVADNGDPKPKPQKPDSPAPSGFAPGIANP